MSARGLSGRLVLFHYSTIHRFSTKFKIRSCFLMNIVSRETQITILRIFNGISCVNLRLGSNHIHIIYNIVAYII